jgi:4-amino-4-deoxy-L-arabinose transferase-like glycosyltransferase
MFLAVFNKNYRFHWLWLLAMGVLFYFLFLGTVHLFDWDEINFAESAREMLVTQNYAQVQINYQPFWEKPPLFFWMQALSMQLFGVNEFAARFPNAVFGIITLFTFYFIGKKLYDRRFGFIWALCYWGAFLPHLYFKSGIIDPVFNYFIFLGIYFLACTIQNKGTKKATSYALWAGICTGLAVLTKGPVGFLLVFLTFLVYWVTVRFRSVASFGNILLFAFSIVVVSFAWFGLELIRNGFWFFEEFIKYQIRLFSTPDAGHEQPFYYHFLVVFLGCFPMSVLALPSFRPNSGLSSVNLNPLNFRSFMLFLFWIVMFLFSIVKTKIVHYSSMAYFPLSFLSALSVYQIFENRQQINKYLVGTLVFFGTIFGLLLTGVPLFAYNKEKFYSLIEDPFAVESLKTEVSWGGWEFLLGLGYLLVTWISIYFLKKYTQKAILALFSATAVCLLAYTAVVVPKIESYSQRPAIEFYEKTQGQDAYVITVGFKSYAQYYYFKVPQYKNPEFYTPNVENWLLTGKIDKPAYFVLKSDDTEFSKKYPQIKKLYQKGGFMFFKREK